MKHARTKHGYFADPDTKLRIPRGQRVVSADWCEDGSRDMILTRPVLYIDPNGEEWLAPTGSRINGASTPFFTWPFMPPYQAGVRKASVIHDVFCPRKSVPWLLSAWLFYHAMRASEFDRFRSWIRWAGVVFFGWWRVFFKVDDPK